MSRLQMDDAKKLWNEMGDNKSWDSLHNILKKHQDQSKGIDDSTVELLIRETNDLKGEKKPFPDSPEKMREMLTEFREKH